MELRKEGGIEMDNNTDLVAGIRRSLIKANDFLAKHDPVCFVDLVADLEGDELIRKYDREQVEDVAGKLYRRGDPTVLRQLSEKFTKLLADFKEGYIQWWLLDRVKAEVVYRIHSLAPSNHPNDWVIEIPVSSGPTMVARLLEEMIFWKVGRGCRDCYMQEAVRPWKVTV